MKNHKKIYLAAPYSHRLQHIIEMRVDAVNKKAAELMMQGYVVFSPISHSHPISKYCQVDPCDTEFYLRQDLPFLAFCDELWILMMDGWEKSIGIEKEKEYAKSIGKPIKYVL